MADIMNRSLRLNKLSPAVGLEPGTARFSRPELNLLAYRGFSTSINKSRLTGIAALLISSFSHMHFQATLRKYYIDKNTIYTNCEDAQSDWTLVWSHFPQANILGKQNNSQNVAVYCEGCIECVS